MLLFPQSPEIVLLTLLTALVLDAVFGEPDWLWRHLTHPVVLAGKFIERCDRALNRESESAERRRILGAVFALALVFGVGLLAWMLAQLLIALPLGWILEATLVAILLAQRSLYDHVSVVGRAFATGGLTAAREAVSQIVGRDPESLDSAGVSRAALESLAENQSDGVTAPAFWYLLFGLPGIVAYKALNTADSIIGHRTPRHSDFGWASARLDDLLNLVPARMTTILITAACLFLPPPRPDSGVMSACRAALKDAPLHRSPNAGWCEAALAGALGVALAGPRRYGDEIVDDAWMNRDGTPDAGPEDIERGLRLYVVSSGLLWTLVAIGLLIALWRS